MKRSYCSGTPPPDLGTPTMILYTTVLYCTVLPELTNSKPLYFVHRVEVFFFASYLSRGFQRCCPVTPEIFARSRHS